MGTCESKKSIKGSIQLFVEKEQYHGDEIIGGMVSYSIQDPKVRAYIQLIGKQEIYEGDKRVQKQRFTEQLLPLSQPEEMGEYEKTFCIPAPNISSVEMLTTGKKQQRVSIKYYLKAYLNFKEHVKLSQSNKICNIQPIQISRRFHDQISIVSKEFTYHVQQWFLGDVKPIIIAYEFSRIHYRAGECIDFQLNVNNKRSSTHLEQVFIALVFSIIDRSENKRLILVERKIISAYQERVKVPYGSEQKFHIQLPIDEDCVTSNYLNAFKMWYHVEMKFVFESYSCRRQEFIENVLVDVVKCENL